MMNSMNRTPYIKACVAMQSALQENHIMFSFIPWYNGCGGQFTFPNIEGDVVCHDGSYGGDEGLFESYHFPWDNDDVTGYMTVEDFISRFKETYLE